MGKNYRFKKGLGTEEKNRFRDGGKFVKNYKNLIHIKNKNKKEQLFHVKQFCETIENSIKKQKNTKKFRWFLKFETKKAPSLIDT